MFGSVVAAETALTRDPWRAPDSGELRDNSRQQEDPMGDRESRDHGILHATMLLPPGP